MHDPVLMLPEQSKCNQLLRYAFPLEPCLRCDDAKPEVEHLFDMSGNIAWIQMVLVLVLVKFLFSGQPTSGKSEFYEVVHWTLKTSCWCTWLKPDIILFAHRRYPGNFSSLSACLCFWLFLELALLWWGAHGHHRSESLRRPPVAHGRFYGCVHHQVLQNSSSLHSHDRSLNTTQFQAGRHVSSPGNLHHFTT